MLSEREIELAHPEAFDFVFGNLPPARRAEFERHLADCRYCQGVIEEYSEIGGIIKLLPPHNEPPADLENRTVAAMVAVLGVRQAEPDPRPDAEVYPVREVHHAAEPETLIQPRPQLGPPAEDATQPRPTLVNQSGPDEAADPPTVIRLPVWRRYPGRLASVVAVAAAIIAAAIVVPLSRGPAQPTVVIALRATAAGTAQGFGAATGQAIARQDASGSWDITLTVQHLKHFDPEPWYECWYVSQDGARAVAAGTFLVPSGASTTFAMTGAVDPRQFRTMEITLQSPSNGGALGGSLVILKGQSAVER